MMSDDLFFDTLRRILERTPPKSADGMDHDLWAAVSEAGLDLLLVPEEMGGAGDAFAEASRWRTCR